MVKYNNFLISCNDNSQSWWNFKLYFDRGARSYAWNINEWCRQSDLLISVTGSTSPLTSTCTSHRLPTVPIAVPVKR
jgi:hypothetical protein